MIKKYKKLQPQKMSILRKIEWFLNKKRGRNDLFLITAPSPGLEPGSPCLTVM